jgi:nucleoside-diphosphate-sugar epimerase
MKIVLTGGTGYIGSAVLKQFVAAGHHVVALVRNETAAVKIRSVGADPVVGNLFDAVWAAQQFGPADAVVHTANTNDESAAQLDQSVVLAAVHALAGTGKPYIHTTGTWIYGNNPDMTEESPIKPPEIITWRPVSESTVHVADLLATIMVTAPVYGHGGGWITSILDAQDDAGRTRLIGDGAQHWPTVHIDDLAALYRIVLERRERLGYVIAASGANPTVRELAEAKDRNGSGVAPETIAETRARLGAPFADAILLDQQTSAAKAKALGWTPTQPSLVDEYRARSQRHS